ncbi:MAG: hypothetical protein P9M00_01545 [Candidatus Tritonobacter lacicola]|nr:hypothetical protein [Candidatus Tritonobacter lacicola]
MFLGSYEDTLIFFLIHNFWLYLSKKIEFTDEEFEKLYEEFIKDLEEEEIPKQFIKPLYSEEFKEKMRKSLEGTPLKLISQKIRKIN